jgi:phage protein D/phage baseplate assembly protein gpV
MAVKVSALPEVTLSVQGAALPAEVMRSLEKVRVALRLSQPAQCELTFSDSALSSSLGIDARLAPGAEISLTAGATAMAATNALFDGQVTAVEYVHGPSNRQELRVRAYDKLHRLRKRQTVRSFTQVSLATIAEQLCADLGVSVHAMEPGPEYQWLIQHRQSDWQFLLQLAERSGLYLTLRDDTLHILTPEGFGEPVALALGTSLLEARVEVNGDAACRSVSAQGWYPARVEAFEGRAETARTGRSVDAQAPPDRLGGSAQRALVDQFAQDDGHAGAVAQAELDRRTASEVTLWGAAEGDARLLPGSLVEVSGIAQSVVGRYVLAEVTHVVDRRSGFVSEISTALPLPGERAYGTSATPGVVSQIDDPERLGRVRVKLPTYANVETDWMGVLIPGAGAGKGLIALPDVGDHVLVLLAHEDPSQGVVLGGLYGVVEPPDLGLEGDARRRFTFVTPGGQRVRLDDASGTIHLENSGGSYVELAPDNVRLHAAANLDIEAPGKQIAISAAAIDFRRA